MDLIKKEKIKASFLAFSYKKKLSEKEEINQLKKEKNTLLYDLEALEAKNTLLEKHLKQMEMFLDEKTEKEENKLRQSRPQNDEDKEGIKEAFLYEIEDLVLGEFNEKSEIEDLSEKNQMNFEKNFTFEDGLKTDEIFSRDGSSHMCSSPKYEKEINEEINNSNNSNNNNNNNISNVSCSNIKDSLKQSGALFSNQKIKSENELYKHDDVAKIDATKLNIIKKRPGINNVKEIINEILFNHSNKQKLDFLSLLKKQKDDVKEQKDQYKDNCGKINYEQIKKAVEETYKRNNVDRNCNFSQSNKDRSYNYNSNSDKIKKKLLNRHDIINVSKRSNLYGLKSEVTSNDPDSTGFDDNTSSNLNNQFSTHANEENKWIGKETTSKCVKNFKRSENECKVEVSGELLNEFDPLEVRLMKF